MKSTIAQVDSSSTQSNIRHCAHCGLPYDWRRSASSSLKMTYCGSLCEKGDLGFTIETLLEATKFRPERETREPAPDIFPIWGKELLAA